MNETRLKNYFFFSLIPSCPPWVFSKFLLATTASLCCELLGREGTEEEHVGKRHRVVLPECVEAVTAEETQNAGPRAPQKYLVGEAC